MKNLDRKRGSVLPIVLVTVIVLELLLSLSLQLYRNRSYTYHLLIDHYQSQSILSFSEHLLTSESEHYRSLKQGVLRYNIGHVSFTTTDAQTYRLTSRLLNGYGEERSFSRPDPAANNKPDQ